MTTRLVFFTLVVVLFLASCAPTQIIATAPYAEPPKTQLATIFIFRTNSMPTKANIKILIDEKIVALLPDERFTWIQVPAGKHSVSAGITGIYDSYANLNLSINSGESYLLQYSGTAKHEFSLFGQHDEIEGLTWVSGGWIRLQSLPRNRISDVVNSLSYVVAKP